jgi:hypothetical protein
MHRPKWKILLGGFLATGLCCAGTAAGDDAVPRVTVDDAAFTLAIADRQPARRITILAPGQQPYFWTLLSANAATLDALRRQGKLPIMHAWRRYVGPVVLENADTGQLEGDIPLDLGTTALADRLQYEVDHTPRRAFTWRTWSRKGALTPGVWSVFVKYSDGTPVLCRVINGVGIPCVYRLAVRAP